MNIWDELEDRNEYIRIKTKLILENYKDTLDMAMNAVLMNDFDIKWISLDFHPSNSLFLNVIGLLKHKVGDIIKSNDGEEMIMIDEGNVNHYIKPVRVVLPTDIVQSGDQNTLLQFMQEYVVLTTSMSQEEIEHMIGNEKFLKSSFTYFKEGKYSKEKMSATDNNIDAELEKFYTKNEETENDFDQGNFELDEIQKQFLKTNPKGNA